MKNHFRERLQDPLARSLAWCFGTIGSLFFLLFWFSLRESKGAIYALKSVWADWALHFAMISSFAYRPMSMWLDHPLLADHALHYPFLVNFFSGMLVKMGASYVTAFFLPSLVFMALFLGAMNWFGFQHLKRALPTQVFIATCLFAGGLGFLYWVGDIADPETFRAYTSDGDRGIFFQNPTLSLFLPQRSLLLGTPWLLWILCRLWDWRNDGIDKVPDRMFYGMAIVSGALILVHPHSFLALAFFAFFYTLQERKHWSRLLRFAMVTAVVACLLYLAFLRGAGGTGGAWYPGWYASEFSNPPMGFLTFWWWNTGPFFFLAAWGTFREKLYRHPFVQAGWALFVLANLFRLQPWLWDNTKIFIWAYIALAIPVVKYLDHLWLMPRRLSRFTAVFLVLLLTASGGTDVLKQAFLEQSRQQMWTPQDLALGVLLREKTRPDARLLTAGSHHHWAASLSGRQIFLGFDGWLWSHGIDINSRSRDVRTMYQGGPAARELLQKWRVTHVVVGPLERADFPVNEAFFMGNYPVILELHGNRVFQIQN